MKQLFFIFTLVAICSTASKGQCVIYADKGNGAWGGSYNDKNEKLSISELTERALEGCRANGGINCTLWHQGKQEGWFAVISGSTFYNERIIMVVKGGGSTEDEVVNDATYSYREEEGIEGYSIRTFYVYNNLE